MKCTSCNERLGNTRCEGCNTLFCLPCMNKHHDGLTQQFQSLTDIRNEVKESLDICQSTLVDRQQWGCFVEIDRWESEMMLSIQKAAADARSNAAYIVAKYMKNISQSFEKISTLMQQRGKEQNYLENDIEKMKNQLNELKDEINNISRKVEVDVSNSTMINWNTLIRINETNSMDQAASSQKTVEKKSQAKKFVEELSTSPKETISRFSHSLEIQCQACRHIFDDLSDRKTCPNCGFKVQDDPVQSSVSRQQSSPRTILENIRIPAYDTRLSPTLNQRPLAKIICSRCNIPNFRPNNLQRSDDRCSTCGYPLS